MKLLNLIKNIASRDYIVEQGVSGGWTYRKWNSGVAECWGHAYGYYSANVNGVSINLPFTFTSVVYANANCVGDGFVGDFTHCWANTTRAVATVRTAGYWDVWFEVKGRWK